LRAPDLSAIAFGVERIQAVPRRQAPEPNRGSRLIAAGIAMLGLPVVLWLGAAVFVAHHLKFPAFLIEGSGEDVIGAKVPPTTGHPYEVVREALGVVPDEFQAGMVENSATLGGWPVDARGWLIRGRSHDTVMLLPAAGGGPEQLVVYAKFLNDAGYTVVMLNSASNSQFGTDFGWTQRKIALTAAHKLRRQGYERIAVLGVSEGAAAAIFAASEEPLFAAVIADSSYANLEAMFRESPQVENLNPAFLNTVIWAARVLYFGQPLNSIAPVEAARSLGKCPLLVIQNVQDPIVPAADGQAIVFALAMAHGHSLLWIAPSKGHGDAVFAAPDEYKKRVLDFLSRAMKNEAPAASN
jgi:uncharacterized protein